VRTAGRLRFARAGISGSVVADGLAPPSSPSPARALERYLPVLVGIALLATAYYGSAKIGYVLEFSGPIGAVVWLPVGVGIAFLYFGGIALWPGLLIGDLLANDYSTMPIGSAMGQTCGNLLEVIVATLLLHRLVPRGSPIATVRGLVRMLAAIALGAAISATVGLLSLRAGGVISTGDLANAWRIWWLGDSTGALIVVPLALAWWPPRPVSLGGRKAEAVVLIAVLAVVSEITSRSHGPWAYLVLCTLLWAALRFGQRGASLAIFIVVSFTVWNTMHYDGPFASDSLTSSILSTQLFIVVAALSALCLSAVVTERERIADQLGASRARLVDAADTERRRIERNLHDGAQQRLVALAVRFQLAGERAEPASPQTAALLDDATAELQLAISELRELAHGIHPSVLSQLGLADAIRSLVAASTVPIDLHALPSTRLDESSEATAYYVIAEAVTNAQKHAAASSIRVSATFARGVLRVEIADDGRGGALPDAGTGLLGLRDRVEAVGGTLDIASPVGRGTRITAKVPATTAGGEGPAS
jgi:signal transduction histidine kinase